MLGLRGKYKFGLMEVGAMYWGTREAKRSARTMVGVMNRTNPDKRWRLLSDQQGFVVIRVA